MLCLSGDLRMEIPSAQLRRVLEAEQSRRTRAGCALLLLDPNLPWGWSG